MKKAFKESKYWFYIPIISLFLVYKMSEWVFEPKGELERQCRGNLMLFTTFIHIIPVMYLMRVLRLI